MITINPVVMSHQMRKDGTWCVKIRITKDRKSAYIATPHIVTKQQLDSACNIIDSYVEIQLQEDVLAFRKALVKHYSTLISREVKEIAQFLEKNVYAPEQEDIKFYDFAQEFIERLKLRGTETYRNYNVAVNRFCEYIGNNTFSFNDITFRVIEGFDQFLKYSGTGPRGRQMYITNIQTIFKEAKNRFNDEDIGVIKIPRDPFARFKKPTYSGGEKRALTIEQLKAIRDVSLHKETLQMARDVFMLSFYLVGINSVDIYNLRTMKAGRITYSRSKTYRRRADGARISIKIEPEALQIIEKYRAKEGDNIFSFVHRYCDSNAFNGYINKYLKKIGQLDQVKIADLNFYAARHTWATLFVNECQGNEQEAAFCLNHNTDYKVTSGYIKKDFARIDRANRRVLDLLVDN